MLDIIFTLISFFSLCLVAVFLSSYFKLPCTVSPFVALCLTVVHFILFGMFNLVLVAGYIYFALCVLIIVLFIIKKLSMPKLSLWFYVFIALSVIMIIYFGVRKPLLNEWDEFSYWGTAVKLMKINHELPVTAEVGWAWVASQKAGLIVLGYFFEFFGSYAQWRIFIGINVLALSVFVLMLSSFRQKNKAIGFVLFLTLVLSPYIFTINREPLYPSSVYMSSLSDIPMAWFFCGVLVLYYVLKENKLSLWPVFVAIVALIMAKDTTLAFAMIAWGIITVDILLFTKCKVKTKIIYIGGALLTVLLSFFAWSLYVSSASGANPFSDIGGEAQMSMAAMVISGITMLFGVNQSEVFINVMQNMSTSFFSLHFSMIGTGFVIVLLIMVMIILSAVFEKEKVQKLQNLCFGVLSLLGFIAYHTFIGFTYAFVFKADIATTLIGYERYIYPYYLAWFAVAAFLLAKSAANAKGKLSFVPQAAMFGILFIFLFRFNQYIPNGMTFLTYHDGYLHERKQVVSNAQNIVELLGEDEQGKIYFISQGDNGSLWFQYSGDILPLQLEYSFGGGTMVLPKHAGDGLYEYALSPQEFVQYLKDNGCEFIFVERVDDSFVRDYGFMFSDSLSAVLNGESVMYSFRMSGDSYEIALLGEVSE